MACPPGHDLVNTPEHLRPGFRGQPRQYDPSEFGLTGREEWQHPRMFRDMTYDTNAAAMETFRQANQPRRQAYDLPAAPNLSNLPEECLADVSMPSDHFTAECEADASPQQQQLCDTSSPAGSTESKNYVDTIYDEIVSRFNSLRERIARGDQMMQSMGNETDKCGNKSTSRGPLSSGVQTNRRKVITTHCDPCGSVTSQIEETSTVLNDQRHLDDVQPPSFFNATDMGAQPLDCTPMTSGAPYASPAGRRINFSLMDQSENLDQITMPSFRDDTLPPTMSTRIGQHRFATDECLTDVSAPSFAYSDSPQSGNAAFQDISDITPPYLIETNECLTDMTLPTFSNRPQMSSMQCEYQIDDVTAPSFNRTMSREAGYSRRQQNISEMSAPSFASSARGVTADRECLQDMSMPSFAGVSGAYRSPRKSEAFSTPSSFGRGQAYNDCLEDMSMPSFGDISGVSRGRNYQEFMPSQNIGEISAPTFGSSGRQPVSTDCLEDMTTPSFGGISGASRGRSSQRRQVSMPSQNICDVSAPSFGDSGRGPVSNDCLEDMTMPSFGGVSGASRGRSSQRRQVSMPSQNIYDISAPSFGSSGRRPTATNCIEDRSPSFRQSRARTRQMTSQNIQDISAPCFPDSGHRTIPTECLEDMSMPSLGVSQGVSRRQDTLPSQCLEDISAPTFERSMSRDPSRRTTFAYTSRERTTAAPSFGGVSASTMRRTQQRQQMEMPSRNIGEISAPSFNSSGRSGPVANECLEDQTMPSFGGISGASRPRYSPREQASMPTQNIRDISAPSFGNQNRRHVTASECLDDMTMPSFVESSNNSRRQVTLPSECLNEVSAPTFARSMSRAASSRRGRGVLPCSTNEQLDDMSMPTFRDISSVNSGRRPNSEPSFAPESDCECVDDVTPLSFGQSASRDRQQSMPSTNIRDISAPFFGDSGRNPMTNECLDDMPTPSSRARSPRRQANISNRPGSFRRPQENECLEDMSMPSFGGISGASRARSPRQGQQGQSMPSQNIGDITAPSFGSSSPGPMVDECLNDMTMPSFGNVSGAPRKQVTLPSERLDQVTAPSFARSIPQRGTSQLRRRPRSFASSTRTARDPMPSECIEDMPVPSFAGVSGAGQSRRQGRAQQPMPSQNICDESAPSYFSSRRGPATNECLEDMTMPSFGGVSGASQGRGQGRWQRSMPLQNICDESAPSYFSSRRGPATNECLEDMTAPSFGGVSGAGFGQRNKSRSRGLVNPCVQRQQRSASVPTPILASTRIADECLENVTMPSFGGVTSLFNEHQTVNGGSYDVNRLRRQRSMPDNLPSECLDDVSAPNMEMSIGSRRPKIPKKEAVTNERLEDVTMSSLRRNHSFPCLSVSQQQQQISDISAPSMVTSSVPAQSQAAHTFPSEQIENISAPFDPPEGSNNCECGSAKELYDNQTRTDNTNSSRLEDVTMPSYEDISYSPRRHQLTMPGEDLNDITEPAKGRSRSSLRRIDSVMPNEQLEDISQPDFYTSSSRTDNRMTSRPENLEDITMPSLAADVTAKSSASIHHVSSEQKVTRRMVKQSPSDQLADESAPSMLNDSGTVGQSVSPAVDEVQEVTVKTSSSVTRIYIKPTDSNGQQNIPIPSLPGRNGGPGVGYLVQGPDQQLITITYDVDNSPTNNLPSYHHSQDGLQSAHSKGNVFITDVTEPSYAPSYDPTLENVYDNMQGNGEATNNTYHGFDSMQNYVPFDELIRSPRTGRNSPVQGNDESLQTPQPVRSANRDTARRSPGSPCQMVNTSYPYGQPRCITRRPC